MKAIKEFKFPPALPTAYEFAEDYRKENPKGNPEAVPLKVRQLILDAFSMCENETQAGEVSKLVESLKSGFHSRFFNEKVRQEKIKKAFGKTFNELDGKFVITKEKSTEDCYGFWEVVSTPKFCRGIRQIHKDNQFIHIEDKGAIKLVSNDVAEYHAALVGYSLLEASRNPIKTIEKLNNNSEIKVQVENIVRCIDSETASLPYDKIAQLIPLVQQLWADEE